MNVLQLLVHTTPMSIVSVAGDIVVVVVKRSGGGASAIVVVTEEILAVSPKFSIVVFNISSVTVRFPPS